MQLAGETTSCEACSNLQSRDMISAMVAYVAQKDAYFGSIQRGSDSPSQVDKESVVHDLYHKSPSVFITRYGHCLNAMHKQFMYKEYEGKLPKYLQQKTWKKIDLKAEYCLCNFAYQYFIDKADVVYQLNLLEKDQKQRLSRVKNRRFTAMKKMMEDGDYFSEEEMKRRDPLLYEQVGRVFKLMNDQVVCCRWYVLLCLYTYMKASEYKHSYLVFFSQRME